MCICIEFQNCQSRETQLVKTRHFWTNSTQSFSSNSTRVPGLSRASRFSRSNMSSKSSTVDLAEDRRACGERRKKAVG